MSVLFTRVTDRTVVTVCLLVCLACSGCAQWEWPDGGGWILPSPRGDPLHRGNAASDPEQPAGASQADPANVRGVLDRSADDQGRSVWIRAIRRPEGNPAPPGHRWRYPDLEELMARPPGQSPRLRRYLSDKNPIVAANAAIALARTGDPAGARRLAETVRAPNINLPMRCAAIEALAGLPGSAAVGPLRELLDQYGRPGTASGSSYHAELHAELIRGLAQHVVEAGDRHFVDALRSRSENVRLEVIRAWSADRLGALPLEAVELCEDVDPHVRCAALTAVAKRRHPQAHARLTSALDDHDVQVRSAAIAALGELGGAEAQATLERLLKDSNERIRGAAVSELAGLGAEATVIGAADDQRWRVRAQVARALARFPDRDGAATARKLLQDPSAEVQRETVLALAEWPLRQAGPVLLEAMGSRSLMTRTTAADQLAGRWPPAAEFPSQGPPQRRATVLERLQASFQQQFSLVDQPALAASLAEEPAATVITPQQLARVEQLVRQQDVPALVSFGPGLIEALEQLVFDRQQVLPEMVYRQVLPEYDPVFDALDRLASSDVSDRRRAARQLAELTGGRAPRRLAVARLGRLVAAEPDQLVWQSVLTAIADDGREPAIRLAYAAISHPAPEVRRRACEHLAAHPDSGHARVLVPALEDRSPTVALAAVRAMGLGGRMDDPGPLRRLLSTSNEQLRLETAIALGRLGDPAGTAELRRLAHSTDPSVCRRVAEAMGEMPDPTFAPTLIRLLDHQVAVRLAALESLPKVVGHDPSEADDPSPATTSDRIECWKRWYAGQISP